jgi:hypothetical protein
MRERITLLLQNSVSWFALWYTLYGKNDSITGVALFTGFALIPGIFLRITLSNHKPTIKERYAMIGTYITIVLFAAYMILCLFSIPAWVYNHNAKFAIFIAINTLVNLYAAYSLRNENY